MDIKIRNDFEEQVYYRAKAQIEDALEEIEDNIDEAFSVGEEIDQHHINYRNELIQTLNKINYMIRKYQV